MDALPPAAVALIGASLSRADRRACLLAARCLAPVCEACDRHTLELRGGAAAAERLRALPRIAGRLRRLMPRLRRLALCFHDLCVPAAFLVADAAAVAGLREGAALLQAAGCQLAVRADAPSAVAALALLAASRARADELSCHVAHAAHAAALARGVRALDAGASGGEAGALGRLAIGASAHGVGAVLADAALLARASRLRLRCDPEGDHSASGFHGGRAAWWPRLDLSAAPAGLHVELVTSSESSPPLEVVTAANGAGAGVTRLVAFPPPLPESGLPHGLAESLLELDVVLRGWAGLHRPDHALLRFAAAVRAAAAAGRRQAGGPLRVRLLAGADPQAVPFAARLVEAFGGPEIAEVHAAHAPDGGADEHAAAVVLARLVPGVRGPVAVPAGFDALAAGHRHGSPSAALAGAYEPPPALAAAPGRASLAEVHAAMSEGARFAWFWLGVAPGVAGVAPPGVAPPTTRIGGLGAGAQPPTSTADEAS